MCVYQDIDRRIRRSIRAALFGLIERFNRKWRKRDSINLTDPNAKLVLRTTLCLWRIFRKFEKVNLTIEKWKVEERSLDLIHWLSLNVSLNVFKGKIFMERISRCYGRIKIVWSIAFENIAKYRSRNFARALTKLKCALLLVSLFGNWKLAIIKGVYICFFPRSPDIVSEQKWNQISGWKWIFSERVCVLMIARWHGKIISAEHKTNVRLLRFSNAIQC